MGGKALKTGFLYLKYGARVALLGAPAALKLDRHPFPNFIPWKNISVDIDLK